MDHLTPLSRRLSRPLAALTAALLLSAAACGTEKPAQTADEAEPVEQTAAPAEASGPVRVKLLSFNDFHGNLAGPTGSVTVDGKRVEAGGIAQMKHYVDKTRAAHPNTLVVAAGDLIGASPLLSSVFHDEPTIEALNMLGLSVSSVGNHEFDEGVAELERMATGGCHPDDGCQDGDDFAGADFDYLAANVIENATGETLFAPYVLREFQGVPVAFIGLTLEDTPKVVSPEHVEPVTFKDEADTINAHVATLQDDGVESIVVLIHEGGRPTDNFASISDCGDLEGPIVDIVERSSDAVDVFVTGHSHSAYICEIDGKLVTSAKSYGRLLTEIDLSIDPETGDVVKKAAKNVVVDPSWKAAPELAALVARYEALSADIANRRVGTIAAELSREPNAAGESALGDVIADAQLAATASKDRGGAQIAFMNPGGIRDSLAFDPDDPEADLAPVTYAELHRVQPFGNTLVTMTLTGAQIRELLEQQFDDPDGHAKILQVSRGLTYAYKGQPQDPEGPHVIPGTLKLKGEPIKDDKKYRVTVNSFLSTGGDGFTVLTEGTGRTGGPIDLDALADYVTKESPVKPGPQDRIKRVDLLEE